VAALEYAPLPFEAAKKFWSMKSLVKDLATIAEPTWQQAVTYGFKVAGISADSALNMIKADLESAIKGEVTVSQFVKAATEKYGINSAHAETVARTNIQTAYSWGHYQQLTDPAVAAVYNVWGFDVVDDPRTSDICRPLIGKAYLTSNKIWDSLYPPNHFNCRTTIFPMALDEVEKMGFTLQDAWPRDPKTGAEFMPADGFKMNIGRVPLLGEAGPAAGNAATHHYFILFNGDRPGHEFHGNQWQDAIGKTGTAASLGLPHERSMPPAGPMPKRINGQEALARLQTGFSHTNPLGREVKFGGILIGHSAGKDHGKRLESLPTAEATVKQPTEIWENMHRHYYISSYQGADGKIRGYNVVGARLAENRNEVISIHHKNVSGLKKLRQGKFLYAKYAELKESHV